MNEQEQLLKRARDIWERLNNVVPFDDDVKAAVDNNVSHDEIVEFFVNELAKGGMDRRQAQGLIESMLGPKDTQGETTDYMSTDDVEAHPSTYERGGWDNAETTRFQTEAAAKEKRLAEGVDASGNNIELVEIMERQPIRGERVRWEVRDQASEKVLDEGGPLYLDDPAYNDASFAEMRGKAYDYIAALTGGNYRDLRGSKKMAEANDDAAEMSACRVCKKPIEKRLLSGIETCPECSAKWVKDYQSYHRSKPSHYRPPKEGSRKEANFVCPHCHQPGRKSDMTMDGKPACVRCAADIEMDYSGKEARDMAKDIEDKKKEASREERIAKMREQVLGMQLTASQREVLADIESRVLDFSEDFINSIGQIMKQPWDPGSSWDVVEANGQVKLVRKETRLDDESAVSKHAYAPGKLLRIDSGVVPDDVIIRECVGDKSYKVQSVFNHRIYTVVESELFDPSSEEGVFAEGEYPIGIGQIANF